jgi:short-subunit dehydrogenase
MRPHTNDKVLILGASSPIARGLALRFAQDGASLYLAAREADDAARTACDISVRTGATACAGTFQALDFASHEEVIRRAADALDGLNGLVVCFGTMGDEDGAPRDSAETVALINQNFTAAASILTIAAERFESQPSGFIIVIGSVAGDRGRARNYVYGSAKGALALFAQGLRGRCARSPLHVMTVILGTVDTRMTWGREGTLLCIAPDRAAGAIFRAWQRKADVVYVPFFWRFIMGGLKMIPERFFKRLRS